MAANGSMARMNTVHLAVVEALKEATAEASQVRGESPWPVDACS
jgi:hypothetical protein